MQCMPPTAMYPLPLPPCSPVEVTVVPGLNSAAVSVVAPSAAPPNGWAKYVLRVCPVDPAGTCYPQDCTPVNKPPSPTSCPLTGLNQGTKYTLRVAAVQGNYAAPSALKSFTTATQE